MKKLLWLILFIGLVYPQSEGGAGVDNSVVIPAKLVIRDISAFTEDDSPAVGDSVLVWDITADELKRVALQDIIDLAGSVAFEIDQLTTDTPTENDSLAFWDEDEDDHNRAAINTILGLMTDAILTNDLQIESTANTMSLTNAANATFTIDSDEDAYVVTDNGASSNDYSGIKMVEGGADGVWIDYAGNSNVFRMYDAVLGDKWYSYDTDVPANTGIWGKGNAEVDYYQTWKGEDNDLTMTWMEDEARLDFSDNVDIGGILTGHQLSKGITIESPVTSDEFTIFFTNEAITISEMRGVVRGTSPDVTWTIRHDNTSRADTGIEVVTAGTQTTSQTSGSDVTAFDDETIPADSFVWIEIDDASGTSDDEVAVTIIFTVD